MALLSVTSTSNVTIGTLSGAYVFSVRDGGGTVMITTDDGTGDDGYPLSAGMSLGISDGRTVKCRLAAGSPTTVLHYMPG